ncbi:Sulfate transport system permease protein CysW [Caulifigura coniformis]|uniref:Sulfate transport system permease protein CysW n=1 Tax=Caulifigura coniformis TaxID=2527983 RepID=A0A517SM25_9PLAN|nr:Sulfate transport system permease protein CysW [Caulifigura coniformis]
MHGAMTAPCFRPPSCATVASLPPQSLPQFSRRRRDVAFFAVLGTIGGCYVLLMVLLLVANAAYTAPDHFIEVLNKPEIRYALKLTLVSCTIAAVFSLWIGTALGYLLSRFRFRGKWIVDTLVDVPIVLPPLVLGLSLLILFHLPIGGHRLEDLIQEGGRWVQDRLPSWAPDALRTAQIRITYGVPAVILAQFSVACAFAIRTMRVTFDQINPRAEQVARTLGCSRGQAFTRITLPQASRGMLSAFTVAWARSLGEFGPILVFAGATRMRTEVLSTTVFLELSVGNLEASVAVSLLMVAMAFLVLGVLRLVGGELGR